MDENAKRRFDTVYQLCKDSWGRISTRHHYSWRAAFTLWTAFGAFIAIALTHPESFSKSNSCATLIGVILIGLAFCIIHWRWLEGLGDANALDRKIARHYEEVLRELSASEFPKELQKEIDKRTNELKTFLEGLVAL